jgi:hypothetical protein
MSEQAVPKNAYQSPIVMDLGRLARGSGYCAAGSSPATDYCEAGILASGGYCTAGTFPGTACTEGISASTACTAGVGYQV